MSMKKIVLGTAVGCLVLGWLSIVGAQIAVPEGGETQVNITTFLDQIFASVAIGTGGNFLVVWQTDIASHPNDPNLDREILARYYDSTGTPLTGEIQVNTYATGVQIDPAVAADGNGNFVVVWQSNGSAGTDTDGRSIQGRRFDSTGAPLSGQFQVNSYTTGDQLGPAAVATETDGSFVVAWRSAGSYGTDNSSFSIQAQRFDNTGAPTGGQFQVNTYTTGFQSRPAVAVDGSGGFVVAWDGDGSYGTDIDNRSVQAQRFDASGAPLGGQFQVNTYTPGAQIDSTVAAAAGGEFVVVWQSAGSYGTDTDSGSIQGQRFDANGVPLGGEFQVNSYTTSNQIEPEVAIDATGNFVVVWESFGSYGTDNDPLLTGRTSIQARRFDSSGAPLDEQFQVNTYTTDFQSRPEVASAPGGDFVVAWDSTGSFGTDTSYHSVEFQRFRGAVGRVRGSLFEDFDGDGIRDPGEPGLAGVDVVVTDSGGTPQTVTSGADGVYTATVLVGDATVDIDEATLPAGAVQTAGTDPTTITVPEGVTVDEVDGFQLPPRAVLELAKSGLFADENGDGLGNSGETVTYTFQLTNAGNVALTQVTLSDPMAPGIVCPGGLPVAQLDPGGTLTCAATVALTQADVDAGRRDNTATAASDQTAPVAASATVLLPASATATLAKSGTFDPGPEEITEPGDLITYSFTVTNTGNVTLSNVTVTDPLVASVSCPGGHPLASLAPGAAVTCSGTYPITQADIDAGGRSNTATVTAQDPDGGPVSAQAGTFLPLPPLLPFACEGTPYLIQNIDAQLNRVDTSTSPVTFLPIGGPTGREINNLGFRSTDGLLYAVELSNSGNLQILQIDRAGSVFGLGRPAGLPTNVRFDAGDVSPDGTTMYMTATNQPLYRLDLTSAPILPAVTSVTITGATGFVFDWAVNPADGRLYGGDSTSGQLAILDPATGVRTDVGVAGLPSGGGYGGAWFGSSGHLFLYNNGGTLFEIDLAGPTIVDSRPGPGSGRNDGAACALPQGPAVTLDKSGSLDDGGDGFADPGDVINYTFTVANTGTETLTDATVSDPLLGSVTCPGGNPVPSLAPGASVTCTGSYTLTQADVDARVRDNTATVTALGAGGGQVTDQASHSETLPVANAGPLPFACNGDPYLVQDVDAQLNRVDATTSPVTFVPIGGPTGREINNLGFRSTDGLLYAVELSSSGNVQILQIDATGAVFGLGRPAGLPATVRFDAGDVSPDGTTMYMTATNQPLYRLDLTSAPTLPAVTSVTITGATGFVFDWAVNPADGRLYGGDSSSGQLAILDPATGVRTDVGVAGLPSGGGYGGAWFGSSGHLFLYNNGGTLFEIDLAGPTIVDSRPGPSSGRNDGAACALPPGPAVALAKSGSLDDGGDGFADPGDVINYTFTVRNSGTETLTEVTVSDPLLGSVTCPGGNPVPSLAPGASVTCTGSYTLTQADVDARVRDNTATVTALGAGGGQVTDQASHSETLPVANAGPLPFACNGEPYLIQDIDAQLNRVDATTSPVTFVPIGGPTGREINNLGFRSTDGLLYAVELSSSGNVQILQIDATGAVFGLGRPSGLPATVRFDAGDVSPDGTTMYITATNQRLYRLDLTSVPTLPAVTSVAVTGASGHVFDWAVNPADGRLYGGDSSSGQLATLDPVTGVRTDVGVAGLPSGSGYGGAWFGSSGHLFLYNNGGTLFEIDLAGPTIVDSRPGPGSGRNDGAACIPVP